MRETQTLARFVAETQFKDLPDALVEESRIVILDTLAAGFVGTVQPWAQRMVEMVRELGGVAEATVLNQPWHTDISRAALANGAFFGAFECEPLSGSHASATVMPAALAVGEREHLDGQTWITAWVLGCEVSARIARTAVGLESVRGFHNPGTQGPFAAAAAVGKLYGFDAQQLASAFGLAGSCAAGLLEFAWSGADTKRIHLGRASQLGLESALLARKGLRGPTTVLEGRYGYYNAFSQPPDLARLLDGLGKEWAIRPPYQKSYATHVTHQSVVQAIQEWRHVHEIDPRHITRVVIRGTPRIMEARHAVRDPDTIMGGQYSLPFTTAVSLTRDMANPLVYNDEAVRDPVVRELSQRIELEPDATLQAGHGVFPSEVRIEAGNAVYALQTKPHKGSPLNPFTWDEICEKFRRYAREIINAEQAEAIIGGITHLEHTADMAEITRLFVVD